MKYAVEIASCGMIYIPTFKMFLLRNLRGCNVDITDGGDFLITQLRWAQVP
jgi:hypothetical protein